MSPLGVWGGSRGLGSWGRDILGWGLRVMGI